MIMQPTHSGQFQLPLVYPFSGRVLVVSEEQIVRRAISEQLEEAGCVCETADSYEMAAQLFSRDPSISLVVVDCVQPSLETQWFVDEVRLQRPDTVVVGSSDLDNSQVLEQVGIEASLPKYWETPALVNAVRGE
ncbi:Hypothetical protein PBC10988_19660 [Planctomycetales bacterium 10988]|nr:Hypothetical protein PBC10988_19660 [Planctomycetales bacterium 10988]